MGLRREGSRGKWQWNLMINFEGNYTPYNMTTDR